MMTPDDLAAKGYSLERTAWGVSVYRTVNATPEPCDDPVTRVAIINFNAPLNEVEASARGWEAATLHYVKERLAQ